MIYDRWKDWHDVREWMLPSLEHCHGSHTEDDVLVRIAHGEYKLWRFEKCAVVTFFIQQPQFKALNIFIAGGDLEELKSKQPEMERWAVSQGCKRVISGGRVGWGRVFPEYHSLGMLYYKEL